jgi:hypothetical protein
MVSCVGNNGSPADENGKQSMGRYVEKDLKKPREDMNGVIYVKKSDGSLDLYIYLDESPWFELYNTKNGMEYEKVEIPWYKELFEKEYHIQSIAYDGKDNKYLLVRAWTEGTNKIYKITEENTLEEIEMEWKESSIEDLRLYINKMEIASNGDLILSQLGNGIVQGRSRLDMAEKEMKGLLFREIIYL